MLLMSFLSAQKMIFHTAQDHRSFWLSQARACDTSEKAKLNIKTHLNILVNSIRGLIWLQRPVWITSVPFCFGWRDELPWFSVSFSTLGKQCPKAKRKMINGLNAARVAEGPKPPPPTPRLPPPVEKCSKRRFWHKRKGNCSLQTGRFTP